MSEIKRFRLRRLLPAVFIMGAMALGCSEDIFDVKNPGAILDVDLNSAKGVDALVTGMSADFSEGFDGMAFLQARGGDEMTGGGSYYLTGEVRRGLIVSQDVDGFWEDAQRARWVAEAGIERMKEIAEYEFAGNPLTGRAYLFAGLANRWLAEDFCYVVFSSPYETDDGTAQARSVGFQRALGHYQDAITNAGGDSDVETAARGGMAQAYVHLGQWTEAANAAGLVDTDFVYYASYSLNSGRENNEVVTESHERAEMSVFSTHIETLGENGDPRTPWKDCSTPGDCPSGFQGAGDGDNPNYQQMKYLDEGADIPLVKGTEMRLIEAEAALRDSDLITFNLNVNEVRTFHGLASVTATSVGSGFTGDRTSMTGWDILERERLLTLWLEGRRLGDFHRWDAEGMTHPYLLGVDHLYELVPAKRFTCYPISDSECQTNPLVADLCIR